MNNFQIFSKIVNGTSKTKILKRINFTGSSYFLSKCYSKVKKSREVVFGVQMASKGKKRCEGTGGLIQISPGEF